MLEFVAALQICNCDLGDTSGVVRRLSLCLSFSSATRPPTRLPAPGRRTHSHEPASVLEPARNQKMRRSGLIFLLCGTALCFEVKIAPPTLGLGRLFRKPYRGPICVIEIVGAELKPKANRGTACSLSAPVP